MLFDRETSQILAVVLKTGRKHYDSISPTNPALKFNLASLHLGRLRWPLLFPSSWLIGAYELIKHKIGFYKYSAEGVQLNELE